MPLYGLSYFGIGKACKQNISGTAWAMLLKFCGLFGTNVKITWSNFGIIL